LRLVVGEIELRSEALDLATVLVLLSPADHVVAGRPA